MPGGRTAGTFAVDMFCEMAVAIEMGADAVGIGWSFILHPILCKRIGMAAEHLNSTLPSTFFVIGDPRLNEINGLRWFLC